MTDGGHAVKGKYGVNIAQITAGSATYDNAAYTTDSIDRRGYNSCKVLIPYSAVLATDNVFTLGLKVSESDAGTTFTSMAVLFAATTIATGTTTASPLKGCYEYSLDLSGYDRYIKFEVTPNCSAANTDTLFVCCNVVLTGAVTTAV